MIFNLFIFIIMFSSQAFADATNHFAGYTTNSTIDTFQTVEMNGNVGIGTATPSSSLSIYNSVNPAAITLNTASSGVDSNTQLLLPLNNNVTDSSQNALTVTNNNVTFSNTNPEFAGTYYGLFNGTNADLSVPNESYFNFGFGNFTIDLWFYLTALPSTWDNLVSKYDTLDQNGYELDVYNAGSGTYQIVFTATNSSLTVVSQFYTATISTNTWYHVAVVRNGSSFTIYLNGVALGTATSSGPLGTNTLPLYIGAVYYNGSLHYYHNGGISELRVSNIAQWNSNFTPPALPYGTPVSQISLQNTGTQEAKIWTDGSDSNKFKIDDSTATRLTISSGNVGIGTTSPSALLDVAGPIRIKSGLITNGTAPTITTGTGDCGTSPSVVGNDLSGTITVGSGVNGGKCTVTFSAAKSSTPNCICQNSTTANLTRAASQSTTSFQCTGTLTAGDQLVYWCPQ